MLKNILCFLRQPVVDSIVKVSFKTGNVYKYDNLEDYLKFMSSPIESSYHTTTMLLIVHF